MKSVYVGRAVPLVVFGIFTIFAGILAIWLPETRNHNLPDTIKDGKEIGK